MFGNAVSYDGLSFFDESLKRHSKFNTWYQNMKQQVINGHKSCNVIKAQEIPAHSLTIEKVVTSAETQTENTIQDVEIQLRNLMQKNDKDSIQTDNPVNEELNRKNSPKEVDSKTNLRILTINYFVHVIAFTFAAWSSR